MCHGTVSHCESREHNATAMCHGTVSHLECRVNIMPKQCAMGQCLTLSREHNAAAMSHGTVSHLESCEHNAEAMCHRTVSHRENREHNAAAMCHGTVSHLESGEHNAELSVLKVPLHQVIDEVYLCAEMLDASAYHHVLEDWEEVIHAP